MQSVRLNGGTGKRRSENARRFLLRAGVVALLFAAAPMWAHIGSPDSFVQTSAGPYALVVSTHPPGVLPGAMKVNLRFAGGGVVQKASVGLDGEPPVALKVSADATGASSVWLPSSDAHTLHVKLEGDHGPAAVDLMLPGWTLHSPPQRRYLNASNMLWAAAFLLYFGCILVLAGGKRRKRNMKFAAGLIGAAFVLAASTWPLRPRPVAKTWLSADVEPDGRLLLHFTNPAEHFDDLVAVADKPLYLFAVREPQHDVFLQLHPEPTGDGSFGTQLPAIPPGTYTLFADMVHAGPAQARGEMRTESVTETMQLPAVTSMQTADPDDIAAELPAADQTASNAGTQFARLPDGYAISMTTDARLDTKHTHMFTLTLLDAEGKPVADPALYLGAPAQAVMLSHDNSVFVHLHSGGTLPLLESGAAPEPSATTSIPYGFPTSGGYRLFVQMKHGTKVETAAFDLEAE